MVSPGHPSTLRRRWWKWWSSGVVNFQAASGVKGLKNFRQADNLIGKIKWKTISRSQCLKIIQKVSFLRAKRATQKNWIFAPKLFFGAKIKIRHFYDLNYLNFRAKNDFTVLARKLKWEIFNDFRVDFLQFPWYFRWSFCWPLLKMALLLFYKIALK